MNKINNGTKDNYIPVIALSLFLGLSYLCYGALYLSSAGIVRNVPAPMSLLIYSLVPVYYLVVPAIIAVSLGMIIYKTARQIMGKRTYSVKIMALYCALVGLGSAFLLAVHYSIKK